MKSLICGTLYKKKYWRKGWRRGEGGNLSLVFREGSVDIPGLPPPSKCNTGSLFC